MVGVIEGCIARLGFRIAQDVLCRSLWHRREVGVIHHAVQAVASV